MKRALAGIGLLLSLLTPVTAGAEAEWTDGSPPPLDFGLQVTAAPSTTAPYTWLRSTDSPAIEQSWNEASQVDLSMLAGVTGGVADGMASAIQTPASLTSPTAPAAPAH
ncbi:MAG TPA: hypothetical protein VFN74_11960 [Chloroflexota bacterium]|nr:hypothetical protein [Chloroflexota bacterium]